MNFNPFSVDTANMFPVTNSHAGGQLMTEYNLRSLFSVETDGAVKYMIGPSFAHSDSDFHVQLLASTDEYFNNGASVNNADGMLEITAGIALVDGYFIESLVPVSIDLAELNNQAVSSGQTPLSGELTIGLRVMFSTEATTAGTILTENSNGIYEGIQVVILQKDEFILPEDSPNDPSLVTAHLKLADFTFLNGSITNIINNPKKCQYIPSNRIGSVDGLLSSEYVKKSGLNPKRLYTFAGKGTDPATGKDTWCDSTDALMVWDALSPTYTDTPPVYPSARFVTDDIGRTVLYVPHKQIDGMKDASGAAQYFSAVALPLPVADYNTGTSGTVDSKYTDKVKAIDMKINQFYALASGHQRAFIQTLQSEADLPPINRVWSAGDYVLIANDETINMPSTEGISYPSTLRVVLPGIVRSIMYVGTDENMPSGLELSRITVDDITELPGVSDVDDLTAWEVYQNFWKLDDYVGTVTEDFFVLQWNVSPEITHYYYYAVMTAAPKTYSGPVFLSGRIPFADTDVIGGFLNVPDDATDAGYVYLDSEGHLRLRDYWLLRSGTAAYQIGEDVTIPTGLTIEGIQSYLDEYVNQRIAFPNINQQQRENPNVINIYITIDDSDGSGGTLTLYDIDSRFSTSIYLHIQGNATSAVTINVADCEKVRIDSMIGGSPTINLYRSCLYYDSDIVNRLAVISDMTLWYERYTLDDPNISVDGMTVSQTMSSTVYAMQDYSASEYWSTDNPNDNHFTVALHSITFGNDGVITKCGVYIRNESTSNIMTGNFVIHDTFTLPLGPGLMYPVNRLNNKVKVTGQFISAYTVENPEGYMVQNTSFSLVTPTYDTSGAKLTDGDIAILVQAFEVQNQSASDIDVWDTASFHYFEGMTTI
jgi:hypothetical protein